MNGLYSPIDQILMISGGLKATLEQPFVGDYRAYDPTASGDFQPAQPQRTELIGAWTLGVDVGLRQDESAAFMVSSRDLPNGEPRIDQATLTIEESDIVYRIVRIHRRVYRGRTDGYVLFLDA